jgi:hypothetical protein
MDNKLHHFVVQLTKVIVWKKKLPHCCYNFSNGQIMQHSLPLRNSVFLVTHIRCHVVEVGSGVSSAALVAAAGVEGPGLSGGEGEIVVEL